MTNYEVNSLEHLDSLLQYLANLGCRWTGSQRLPPFGKSIGESIRENESPYDRAKKMMSRCDRMFIGRQHFDQQDDQIHMTANLPSSIHTYSKWHRELLDEITNRVDSPTGAMDDVVLSAPCEHGVVDNTCSLCARARIDSLRRKGVPRADAPITEHAAWWFKSPNLKLA